ncbi:alpha/beta-hydrolase [Pseudovirgaria hyperparasitica]|uniref:Alpha/beta-hydrolase n=1 Tax=Pseudovirgaria hyperparasitica TaxID=470096 RepID=A0A6A6VZJ8_9PEZI|nr:alpha/beta-hydrolase [Pseudovirgaria hyperparasitica]KAF2756072.1 alpha/beta-hydrolase [Pseudovirgaria hyperparasitica]
MIAPTIADRFHAAGITVLLYDPRSFGESDGVPREDVEPYKQMEDYSDAFTFLLSLPTVDPRCAGVWGISLSASTAACAGALDARMQFVIAISPPSSFSYSPESLRYILNTAAEDQGRRSSGKEPIYCPALGSKGECLLEGMSCEEDYGFILEYLKSCLSWTNRCTIQSFCRLLTFHPKEMLKRASPKSPLIIGGDRDMISPVEDLLEIFHVLKQPKRWHLEKGKGHFDVHQGESCVKVQTDWIRSIKWNLDQEE